jgi:hypothetical protein
VPKEFARLLLASLAICLAACQHKTKSMSFYYWRTTYAPDSTEKQALKKNDVHTLYIRYFDVDWPDTDAAPAPVSPIRFTASPAGYSIVPVIFFRNRVFEKLDSTSSRALAEKVLALILRIDVPAGIQPKETQFDCDWTERSRDNYFRFIREYHALSGLPLSSTIRLYQLKYHELTGIPPVDHGILLFYNMGNIDAGAGNSIYDRTIAHRYTPSLRTYPLMLDVALPIFSWGLQVRDGRVVQILDKLTARQLDRDTNFSKLSANRYTATHPCFKDSHYFKDKDTVKVEAPTANDLLDMVDDLNKHSNQKIRDLIFFDLDSQNLIQYDKGLFKEVLDRAE